MRYNGAINQKLVVTMSNCPECGDALTCTAESGNCWCMQFPNVLPVNDKANLACLCQTCLAKKVNAQLSEIYQTYTTNELIRLAKPYAAITQLVDGLDYTMENGFMVFSAWYHLKRGTCCGNGCRHCPFGKSPDSLVDQEDPFNNVG
ncbi:DUF5522 domain-containing protein [Enterovibrio makurazakiensis]|uniref:cysteine-rich CWC family protein n=1 Tax=Enterovibrio makurazakiensis TaxID=2910232 RepID=UPI003D1BB9B5